MVLTIGVAVGIGLLGLIGLARGVRAGLVAIAGTLLAAVLVDLWSQPLGLWVRRALRPELPALPTFLLVAVVFLLTVAIIGYGGSVLLPGAPVQSRSRQALDRALGGLLGALNGALIVSYLLRYADAAWANNVVTDLVATSPLAGVLREWLPWFVLSLVATTGLIVLIRGVVAFVRTRRAAPRAPAPVPPPAAPSSIAGAPSRNEPEHQAGDASIDKAVGKH
ncbi:MAG: CvpA family protein [Chloroflexaceae bacterium]